MTVKFGTLVFCILLVEHFAHAQTPATAPASQPLASEPEEIAQRLDAVIPKFSLESAPIPDVIRRLSETTGVPLKIQADALAQLPWGARTKLASVNISNATLREALTQVLSPIGLQFKVQDNGVLITLVPAIDRMEGRATWNELNLLHKLMTTPYSPEAFGELKIQYRLTAKVDGPSLLTDQLTRSGKGSIAQMLETATGSRGWAWVPEDDHIVIIPREAAIARALSAKVTGHYEDRRLVDILRALGTEADVHIYLQPGTFKALPKNMVEHYSLRFENASIRQALEFIAADTGLAYQIKGDGVHVGPAPDIAKMAMLAAPEDDPYVARIRVPIKDGTFAYEFVVRESELPVDVLSIRRKTLQSFMQDLRRNAPSSQPTSQPASSQAASKPTATD